MNHTPRIFRFAVAAVAAAVAASATAPAQAAEDGPTFKRNKAERMASEQSASTTAVDVLRIGGKNRIETAILASQFAWADAGTPEAPVAGAVVLARADDYADALGGGALAGAASAPLLMTPTAALNDQVALEIDRVLGGTGTVYLLGGLGALSAEVEKRLVDSKYTVVRLAGADRFSTSVQVAKRVSWYLAPDGIPQFVMATTGLDFPDGLAAGATAGGYGATVVLTKGTTVPTVVSDYLKEAQTNQVPLFAVGGQAAAAPFAWDYEVSGKDRFETAAQVADLFWGTSPEAAPAEIGLATGLDWPDALAGGAYMAGYGPLMLTKPTALPAPTSAITSSLVGLTSPSSVQGGVVLGGTTSVSDPVMSEFGALLNPAP